MEPEVLDTDCRLYKRQLARYENVSRRELSLSSVKTARGSVPRTLGGGVV